MTDQKENLILNNYCLDSMKQHLAGDCVDKVRSFATKEIKSPVTFQKETHCWRLANRSRSRSIVESSLLGSIYLPLPEATAVIKYFYCGRKLRRVYVGAFV